MLIMHIGSWKTGTTAFQFSLRKARGSLSSHQVEFLDTRNKWFTEAFLPLFKVYVRRYSKGNGYQSELAESVDCFLSQCNLSPEITTILSWEAGLGHPLNSSTKTMYHPEATARWIAELSGKTDVRVTLVKRNQVDLVQSMYAQDVRKGRFTGDFSEFITQRLPEDLSWKSVLEPFDRNGIKENLRVLKYEEEKADTKLYFKHIAWETYDFSEVNNDTKKNPSFSSKAIQMMRLCSPFLDREEIKIFEKFLVENYSTANIEGEKLATVEDIKNIQSRIRD